MDWIQCLARLEDEGRGALGVDSKALGGGGLWNIIHGGKSWEEEDVGMSQKVVTVF